MEFMNKEMYDDLMSNCPEFMDCLLLELNYEEDCEDSNYLK